MVGGDGAGQGLRMDKAAVAGGGRAAAAVGGGRILVCDYCGCGFMEGA